MYVKELGLRAREVHLCSLKRSPLINDPPVYHRRALDEIWRLTNTQQAALEAVCYGRSFVSD